MTSFHSTAGTATRTVRSMRLWKLILTGILAGLPLPSVLPPGRFDSCDPTAPSRQNGTHRAAERLQRDAPPVRRIKEAIREPGSQCAKITLDTLSELMS